MAIYKNKAGQKLAVYAFDPTTGDAVTGDSANITATISLDGAAGAATNDANPTEIGTTGVYVFYPTQAETNADLIVLAAVSGTADVLIEPLIVFTEPEARILDAAYDAAKTAATQASVTAIATILSGITSLANWLRAMLRSDTPDSTALAEINTGGGAYAKEMSQQTIRSMVGSIDLTTGNIEQVVSEDGVIIAQGTTAGKLLIADGKVAATLTSTDVTGNLPAQVKGQDNIDFGALQKAALNAASVTVSDKTGFSLSDDYNAAKSAASQTSVDALPATLSAAHGSGSWEAATSGDGAHAVLVTVEDDGGEPLTGARVRLALGGISYIATADAAGVAEFGVNEEGTYSIVISRPGFAGYVDTLDVAGAETEELVVMAQQAIPAPTLPGQIVCYGVTLTAGGELEGGVDIVIELLTPGPAGVYSRALVEVTSDDDGQFSVELARESTYQIRRAQGRRGWVQFETTDADSMELPAV